MSTPEETDHKLQDLREAQQITRRASGPTPSSPSLQSVVEGAADEAAQRLTNETREVWQHSSVAKNPAWETALEKEAKEAMRQRDENQTKLHEATAMTDEAFRENIRLLKAMNEQKSDLTALRTRCEELERDKERLESLFERGEVVLGRSEDGDVMLKWRDKCYYGTDVPGAVDAARKEGQQAHEKGEA